MRALFATVTILLSLSALASAEVTQRGDLRVAFEGRLTPKALPRHGSAPVAVEVATTIAAASGEAPPSLQKITIAINRHGHLEPRGLPICEVDDVQPSTTEKALEACGASLVGKGHFSAKVLLPEQAPFPSEGEMFAFNGVYEGKPAILAHVYGTEPVPTSFTLPFVISKTKGTFATVLTATLPDADSNSVTGIEMTLQRRFTVNGKERSYASAGCPAPEGFPGAVFPFVRATFGFAGERNLTSVLTRSCKARG